MGRILIVEDNKIVSKGLANIARNLDSSLEIIETGYAKEALSIADKQHIDAFFLDIQLLDYSGLSLAAEIRKKEDYVFTPIVFITAVPTRELEAFRKIHCYDYVIKPFKEEEVVEVFRTVIKHGIPRDNHEETIKLKQKEFSCIYKQDDIIFIEAKNRKVNFVTIKEEAAFSMYTLNQILELLNKDIFIQCHRGFIVNMKYIEKIDWTNHQIVVKGKQNLLPIGRKYKDIFRGEWN